MIEGTIGIIDAMGCPRSITLTIRAHWGIENRFHWILNISLREDLIRVRKGHGPETRGILRHIVYNLLQQDPDRKSSITSR